MYIIKVNNEWISNLDIHLCTRDYDIRKTRAMRIDRKYYLQTIRNHLKNQGFSKDDYEIVRTNYRPQTARVFMNHTGIF